MIAGFRARMVAIVASAMAGLAMGSEPAAHAEEGVPPVVIFGGDADYPPFEWLEDGIPRGFHADLVRAIGEIGGVGIEHHLGDWPDIVGGLESGDIDVVPMIRSEAREQVFGFTVPFYYLTHSIYGPVGAEAVHNLDRLAGKRVVVEGRSYAHIELERHGGGIELVLAENTRAALEAIVLGNADYGVLAVPTADRLIYRDDIPAERVGPPFWPTAYAFAVRKDREDFLRWLENTLELTFASGRYARISDAWARELSARPDLSFEETLRGIAVIGGPLAAIALLATGWSWSLRRTVSRRTRELADELLRRKQAELRLRHAANHDSETGLPTPDHFAELADRALRDAEARGAAGMEVVALRLADLERVVRTFGYASGQEVVRRFAQRLQDLDFAVCGHAGRGVFLLLSDPGMVRANLGRVTAQMVVEDLALYPQVVAGAASWPDHGRGAAELVRRAETALSVSAERHQAWADYDAVMEPDETDLRLVADFRRSGGSGLHAVYQPQIDLASGRVVAAEILVRWKHPELGPVSPARFIPLLENVGLVSEVTAYMVDQAVRTAAMLRRSGWPCTVCVNVAAYDLVSTDLQGVIAGALGRHRGLPSDIQLELTETGVAEDPAKVREVLGRLRDKGVLAAVDDFGTGYSSVSYLSAFPIHELKVDQMFVRDLLANERHHSIVRSTISMAHELGLTVVAEGAEENAAITMLRDDGCDRVQGYAIAKPLPEAELAAFIRRGRAAAE